MIEHPSDVGEVAEAVGGATERGLRVRVAGAGHSFTDAVCTPDLLLILDRMSDVLEVDAARGSVRVQGGCTLATLTRTLREHGLALRNLGDIDRQTIAGSLATATHGTGCRLPTLAEDATEIELVDASGTLRVVSNEDDEDAFRAAQVSIGAIGVVTAVTLRCEPAFRLRAIEEPQHVERLLEQLPQLVPAHDHFEAFLFPHSEVALARWADRTADPVTERGAIRKWLQETLVGNYLFEALLALGRAAPPLVPTLNRIAAASTQRAERVQDSNDALASRRLMRFVEMEWMLPIDAAATAVREVRELVRRDRLKVNMPIELRFTAPDRAFLSPAHGRQSCCVAVHAYRGTDWQPYFRAVERAMWELDGRPHWGKLTSRHSRPCETATPPGAASR